LTKSVTGNALLTESDTYTWDEEGRMTSASITISGVNHVYTYGYDDRGIRVSLKVDSASPTKYLIDRSQAYDQVLEEYAPSGVLAATYIRGYDLLFQDRSATQSYYIKDGLGSTRALAGSTANVTDTYTYDAYGNMTASSGTTVNSFLFAGYQTDTGTGLDYLRARYLNTGTGRFASRDGYNGDSSNPLSLNHYLYGSADPVGRVDYSGHDDSLISLSVTIGLVGVLVGFSGCAGSCSGSRAAAVPSTLTVIIDNSNPVPAEFNMQRVQAHASAILNNAPTPS
jgi:RHS repeat-associated protein